MIICLPLIAKFTLQSDDTNTRYLFEVPWAIDTIDVQ